MGRHGRQALADQRKIATTPNMDLQQIVEILQKIFHINLENFLQFSCHGHAVLLDGRDVPALLDHLHGLPNVPGLHNVLADCGPQ